MLKISLLPKNFKLQIINNLIVFFICFANIEILLNFLLNWSLVLGKTALLHELFKTLYEKTLRFNKLRFLEIL